MRPPHRLKIANLENHIGDFFFSAFSHPQSLLYSVRNYFLEEGEDSLTSFFTSFFHHDLSFHWTFLCVLTKLISRMDMGANKMKAVLF